LTKKKREEHKREFTKHQMSRWQQQQKRHRLFMIAGISVIAVVAGVIGGGWYRDEYLPMRETVIKVNDTEFSMGYYVDMLELQGQQYMELFPPDQAAMYLETLADQVDQYIQQTELMEQSASDLGIVVSDAEVTAKLNEPDSPLSADYSDMLRRDLLIEKLLSDYFEKQVPTVAEQRHVKAMFLESESQAVSVRARLKEGEDFDTLAEELSLYKFSEEEASDLGWHPETVLSDEFGLFEVEEYTFANEAGSLSQPLEDEGRSKDIGYWLAELLEKDEDLQGELFHIRVMLLGSEAEAQDMRERLAGGEHFADLAEEYSQHTTSQEDGGDLGFLNPDDIQESLKDFVASAEAGDLSEPVEDDMSATRGGYWLVEVAEREDNRQISDEDREFLKAKALTDWDASLREDPANEVESYLDSEKKAWAIEKVLG